MHGPRISIIVAVYRTEKYLSRCIMSILNQTYTNLEILLVDDGSPDHCPWICDSFAALDSRIKVIHKENGGLFSAWNAGVEQMTGEYVSFIDSDDFVSKDYVKSLLMMCRKHHCDISSCSLAYGSEHDFSHVSRKGSINVYDNIGAFMSRKIKAHVNGRLYKASLFINESFRNVFCVDEDFTYRLFYKAKQVAFTDRKLYYYYQSQGSMTRNNKHYISTDFIDVLENRIHYFSDKEEELQELSWEYYCICLMLIYMKCRSDKLNRNDKGEIRSYYNTAYQRVMKNKLTSPLYKLMLSVFFIAPNVCSIMVYGLQLRKRH